MSRLLTPAAVADQWGVSVRYVQKKIAAGELQAVAFGPKLVRVYPEAVDAYEAARCQPISSSAPSSTASPVSGTSHGRMGDARVVSLQRRMTSGGPNNS